MNSEGETAGKSGMGWNTKRVLLIISSQLIPAPRGTGLVASPAVKRFLQLAGVEDAYTSSAGSTKTLENTLKATFSAVSNTYGFLTPNLWKERKLVRSPLEEYADTLREKRF
jgi:small subunit ribosomal protein S2e